LKELATPFEVLTDHKNLKYFRVPQKLNCRWSLYFSPFDFTLQHKPGTSMSKPDALLRRADHGGRQNDNDNMTLLYPELFRVRALSAIALVGPERDILRDIQCSLRDDKQEKAIAKAACELQKDRGWGTVRSARMRTRTRQPNCKCNTKPNNG
jgi:hypothetical protein